MVRIIFAACFAFIFQCATAQQYTHADTLRGSLSPARDYDVKYYDLNIDIDTASKQVKGAVLISFSPNRSLSMMQVDLAANLTVDSILWRGQSLSFTREADAVFCQFKTALASGKLDSIRFHYSGKPAIAARPPWDGGFVWSRDAQGNPWIAVACEGMGASTWWPCKDHLSDEPDSMMIRVAVPKGLTDVSNGRLVATVDMGDKTRFDWFVSYPINSYNVTFNIGKYEHFSDQYQGAKGLLDLDYYVMPYNLDKAKKQFEQVKPMMACYEQYFGPYPFWRDGYKLVETPYLGMEHQSAVAYGNKYLSGYSGWDISRIGMDFDYIIIHETGHEWWGNNVSCKDIADLWVHEGFCTYSEALYVECMYDKATALRYVNARQASIDNKEPIIGPYGVNKEGAGDMYDKGMQLLNTLRSVVDNDELWFAIIKGIQTDFALQTVTTQQIEQYIIKKSGKDLSKIFDQYLRHAAIPMFEYALKYDKKNKQWALSYRWKADVSGFNMPIRVSDGKGGWTLLKPTTNTQTILLPLLDASEFQIDTAHYYILTKSLKKLK
ncbi:MAG: M1 family metallopeptidase [Chitinophagales bacterium]|nr:M1 family metallopeptidase [Chitinophagales bacterium]